MTRQENSSASSPRSSLPTRVFSLSLMNVATRDLQITSGKKPLRHRELLYRAQWGIGLFPVLRK